ncbi:hypothetical protein CERSUDRAFT_99272 [Gelatoporia subvermispora B]|uniref:F-box domain-containing protein n=1 Tax=Ceriporiopsis subvermispora (strain B) TaxID=914234 RepID=M2R2S4_CERS8|nr:hypothetical protein CERSUDRAFT_99272 [Gelatoporia subvermispora B]
MTWDAGSIFVVAPPRDGFLAYTRKGREQSLWVRRLASATRGLSAKEWYFADIGFKLGFRQGWGQDFDMRFTMGSGLVWLNPSEDLIALVEATDHHDTPIRIHLWSINLEDYHPLAVEPILVPGPMTLGVPVPRKIVDMHGDFLALNFDYVCSPSRTIMILNWKTGIVHLWLTGFDWVKCAFLSDYYMLVVAADRAIDEGTDRRGGPLLFIYNYQDIRGLHPKLHRKEPCVCQLGFPNYKQPMLSRNIELSTLGSHWEGTPYFREHAPFYMPRSRAFIKPMIDVNDCPDIWEGDMYGRPVDSIIHLIPLPLLLHYAGKAERNELEVLNATTYDRGWANVDWKEWGPHTFMLRTHGSCQHAIFGTKLVLYHEPTKNAHIYDFNQRRIKYLLSRQTLEDINAQVTTQIGSTRREDFPDIFDDPIVCRLACIRTVLRPPWLEDTSTALALDMSEDTLIFLSRDKERQGPRYVIATF